LQRSGVSALHATAVHAGPKKQLVGSMKFPLKIPWIFPEEFCFWKMFGKEFPTA
jgi:hypothetical protein